MTSGGKTSSKRAAPSQMGPRSKKAHSEKPHTKDEKPSPVKRSKPVTLLGTNDSDISSEEDEDSSEGENAELMDEDDEMLDVTMRDPNGGWHRIYLSETEREADGSDGAAAREAHKAQKILLDQRKASKPHAELLRDAKRVWSLARQKNVGPGRKKHITDLMTIVRGHVKDIVFKHDASRIIQTIVRWGGPAERNEIAAELKGSFKDLSESKYSKVRSSMCTTSHSMKPDWHSF